MLVKFEINQESLKYINVIITNNTNTSFYLFGDLFHIC